MSFVIQDGQLPASITEGPMTDEEFAGFCVEHPDLDFEMTAEGEVILTDPAYPLTAVRNARICRYLDTWSEADRRGIACDLSGGFVLPDGSRRSPDASWTLKSRVRQVASKDGIGYWHLCPDFVIDLRSETDRLKPLQKKMSEYLNNGAQLGWLIDPQSRTVAIYRPGQEVEVRLGADQAEGEGLTAVLCWTCGRFGIRWGSDRLRNMSFVSIGATRGEVFADQRTPPRCLRAR